MKNCRLIKLALRKASSEARDPSINLSIFQADAARNSASSSPLHFLPDSTRSMVDEVIVWRKKFKPFWKSRSPFDYDSDARKSGTTRKVKHRVANASSSRVRPTQDR